MGLIILPKYELFDILTALAKATQEKNTTFQTIRLRNYYLNAYEVPESTNYIDFCKLIRIKEPKKLDDPFKFLKSNGGKIYDKRLNFNLYFPNFKYLIPYCKYNSLIILSLFVLSSSYSYYNLISNINLNYFSKIFNICSNLKETSRNNLSSSFVFLFEPFIVPIPAKKYPFLTKAESSRGMFYTVPNSKFLSKMNRLNEKYKASH